MNKNHKCPDFLKGEAARAWDRLTTGMVEAGIWDPVYHAAVEMLCTVYGRWTEASRRSLTSGPGQEQWRAVAREALSQTVAMIEEFGKTEDEQAGVIAWLVGDSDPSVLFQEMVDRG